MKIYCCQEHVDFAIDTIVDEVEEAPYIQKLEECDYRTCNYCSQTSTYLVYSDQNQ